jgi:secondary thiamine-phosphate synthase enzyme
MKNVMLETRQIEFNTKGFTQIVDITEKVQQEIITSGFEEGNVTLFAIGSTTGLSTIEYEPGLVKKDISEMFDKLAPYGVLYAHNQTWGDDNGAAHVRSTLQGSSLVVPFVNSKLTLGTWQQIIFIDFDTRPRSRKVIVQIIGMKKGS